MIMIEDDRGRVLVLDKIKREGWEGLTFPGGKVEAGESFEESVRREAKEETGLDLGKLHFCGFVHWMHDGENFRQLGLLYRTREFYGQPVSGEEGELAWMDFEEFIDIQPKSDSMDEILRIYRGEYSEVWIHYQGDQKGKVAYN